VNRLAGFPQLHVTHPHPTHAVRTSDSDRGEREMGVLRADV
jgi:hypothetical protein